MRYVDRGNAKLIPFLMPEHKALLRQYYREVHGLDIPNYDGRLDLTVEAELNEAIRRGGTVFVAASNNGVEHRFEAYVEKIDYEQDIVTFRKDNYDEEPIRFNQLISVSQSL